MVKPLKREVWEAQDFGQTGDECVVSAITDGTLVSTQGIPMAQALQE